MGDWNPEVFKWLKLSVGGLLEKRQVGKMNSCHFMEFLLKQKRHISPSKDYFVIWRKVWRGEVRRITVI